MNARAAEIALVRRRVVDRTVTVMCVAATIAAIFPLIAVLGYVAKRGASAMSWSFFTALPKPVGEDGGGMGNAILGTLELVALATLIGAPIGILAGVYVAEYRGGKLARIVRFSADVMSGVPSIVVGIFVYALVVVRLHHFSALAGALSLAILMVPIVLRTTEELLKLVPDTQREAALALGAPKWKATIFVVLRAAAPGIATGVMLAVARVAGETAPLLFTAFNNRFWSDGLNSPVASLPVQIFTYSVSPYDDWRAQAWAAAFTLVAIVLVLNVVARVLLKNKVRP